MDQETQQRPVNVLLKYMSGNITSIFAYPDWTVWYFKFKVNLQDKRLKGGLDHEIRLFIAGEELQDSDQLRHYNIEHETTLDIALVPIARYAGLDADDSASR